jgi:glycosyltransferase involved in cell wall biosynthesis
MVLWPTKIFIIVLNDVNITPQLLMNIAYLNNMLTSPAASGGHVHVSQVAEGLFKKGHHLYTNLAKESDRFVKLSNEEFGSRGNEIDVFYIRVHGHAGNDELTNLRKTNTTAPCVWEVNAPLEELVTFGYSYEKFKEDNRRRLEIARNVDIAICVSEEMAEYAREILKIPKVYVVPNGSDPAMFSPGKRNKNIYGTNKFAVLWAGSSKYVWQGHQIVKEVAKVMKEKDRDIIFYITADGESKDNIVYLGNLSYEMMPTYMASADLGLCLYEEIKFYPQFYFSPLKLFDYMASGLPVIGSNVGQIKKVLTECECGMTTSGDISDIVEKILLVKNNRIQNENMSHAGRKAVLDFYHWGRVCDQLESIFLNGITSQSPSNQNLQDKISHWMSRIF